MANIRESEAHFSMSPSVSIGRSVFNRNWQRKMTFDSAELVPICKPIEVLPGDTFQCAMASAVRMSTPMFPVMDDSNIDIFWFYVPNRLVWEHWQEFCGENNSTYWTQPTEYTVPQLTAPDGGWSVGSLADYFGLPIGVDNISVSALPFRAYCKVWNDFFRDENVSQPVSFSTGDSDTTGKNADASYTYVTYTECGAKALPAAKFHDVFTSALPSPQKGDPVSIPGTTISGLFPVVTGSTDHLSTFGTGLRFIQNGTLSNTDNLLTLSGSGNFKDVMKQTYHNQDDGKEGTPVKVAPSNLYADVSAQGTAVTITALRQAFAVQQFLETSGRCGSRYTEILKGHFGVTSPDARLQRSEYLGGAHIPVAMNQVIQTSESGGTPLGSTAAYSLTNSADGSMWSHSFVEHGYVLGLACVRTQHSYQQGIDKLWSRKTLYEYYWPEFANISDQPILNKEVYAQGSDVINPSTNVPYDDEVFGYQEAWYDYRYTNNEICGKFRSTASGSLDSWHYGDDYESLPHLSHDWIVETPVNVARTLAVKDEPQFLADFAFRFKTVRPMPTYSIPGLTGHF